MAKPNIMCKLKHGDIITNKNYPSYVETFNSTVERVDKIKGDGDNDPKYGNVIIDLTDWEHPVIKLSPSFLQNVTYRTKEPWDIEERQIVRGVYQIGCYEGICETSSILLCTAVSSIYCTMDLKNISACVTNAPIYDPQYYSAHVMDILSGNAIYYNRNPVAPSWGGFYVY